MKRPAGWYGRLHWIVVAITYLMIALLAWRRSRSPESAIVPAVVGLGFLFRAMRRDPNATGNEKTGPLADTSPAGTERSTEPRGRVGVLRMLALLAAVVLMVLPLFDLALHLTPYRLVWSGAHAISPLHAHELVWVDTEFRSLERGQVAWLPREWAGGSELAPLLAVGPDSVRSDRFTEVWVLRTTLHPDSLLSRRRSARRPQTEGRLVQLVRSLERAYDVSSWAVPAHWVAVVYATRADADTGVTIIPLDWVGGVGRKVLFPRVTSLP